MSGCIFLVRHGQTEWNLVGRYQGWGGSPLTPLGIVQAEAIGHHLRDIAGARDAAIVASPIGRARRSAELIRKQLGSTATLTFDDRLREIGLGSWAPGAREHFIRISPQLMTGRYLHTADWRPAVGLEACSPA